MDKLKKANESFVIEDIKSEMENLSNVWQSKASSMYDASNAQAQTEAEPVDNNTAKKEDGKKIKDADFEVVEEE